MIVRRKRPPYQFIENIKICHGVTVITLSGNFDMESTPRVCGGLGHVIKKNKVKAVLLDFKQIDRVDTTAFACMVTILRDYVPGKGRIAVVNLKKSGKELSEILKVNSIIHNFDSKKEAIEYLQKKEAV